MSVTYKAFFNLPKFNSSNGTHSTLCGPALWLLPGWVIKPFIPGLMQSAFHVISLMLPEYISCPAPQQPQPEPPAFLCLCAERGTPASSPASVCWPPLRVSVRSQRASMNVISCKRCVASYLYILLTLTQTGTSCVFGAFSQLKNLKRAVTSTTFLTGDQSWREEIRSSGICQ